MQAAAVASVPSKPASGLPGLSYHPKTGEPRRVRQPLRRDRLPLALLDRIRAERAKGHSWAEIERDSPNWQEWEEAPLKVLAAFPDRRLPHSNLQRWHDLRVEQVQRERDGQAVVAQSFADRLAARGIANLGPAVKHALSESVFRLALEGTDEQLIRDELCRLARVMAVAEHSEIARRRLEPDRRKVELAAQRAEVARLLAQNEMNEPKLARCLHGLGDSPAFQPYFAACRDGCVQRCRQRCHRAARPRRPGARRRAGTRRVGAR